MTTPFTHIDVIKKLGKGKTLSKHLTTPEAYQCQKWLLDKTFTDSQLGAVLQSLRILELDQNEMNGFLSYLYEIKKTTPPISNSIVLNISSDTHRKGGLLSILSIPILCKLGYHPIIIHSEPIISDNYASLKKIATSNKTLRFSH